MRNGATGNIIGNWYQTKIINKQKDALIITEDSNPFYLQDNVGVADAVNNISKDIIEPNNMPHIKIQPASILKESAHLNNIGAQPQDIIDQNIVGYVLGH